MPSAVAPPGWPPEVRAPATPDWERTAVDWLLDLCPPDYRGYPAVRRHPVVLARFAVLHVEACQAAVRRGLGEARADLRGVVDLEVIEAAVETWLAEEARLLGVRRAVGLVEQAIRGRRFVARMEGSAQSGSADPSRQIDSPCSPASSASRTRWR